MAIGSLEKASIVFSTYAQVLSSGYALISFAFRRVALEIRNPRSWVPGMRAVDLTFGRWGERQFQMLEKFDVIEWCGEQQAVSKSVNQARSSLFSHDHHP